MAAGSLKRRQSKRSNSKPPAAMASRPSHQRFLTPRNTALLVSSSLVFFVVLVFGISFNVLRRSAKYEVQSPMIYSIEVVNEFPHDPRAFTQGLVYADNDTLFESTGLYGESSVRKVALSTGKAEALHKMDDSQFGEGLTLFGERLFQVTWLKKTGFIYDRDNLRKVKEFTHQMSDGWGLATDGKVLFGSDGTSTLYQIEPETFTVTNKWVVRYQGDEVHNLNELEFVNGEIWANVWMTDCIVRISIRDGSVLGWVLLPTLRRKLLQGGRQIDVLNGIAWDSGKNRLFVTGKLWPKLFEIRVQPSKEHYGVGTIKQLCLREAVHFH
ncbi:glutaminyl-peptide cyclotransferase-like [Cucurbita moschata]|uniref:Glutaminyl-peptide cyclotransferase-like n=1 Tax=Cucurbita moschata TaxID=3662 RepID=A0A6J1EAT6_CUCMO|nr:glutaminyl-peptide cyclotransferase-like [Cucurbita moschata]XP_022923125.1 glutaminyl-peptide cyclotransferase-like [Cucurbita moschata]